MALPAVMTGAGWRRKDTRHVDREGELLAVPFPLSYVWLVLAVLTVLEALNDLFGFAGPHWLYDNWVHNVVLVIAAVIVLARAVYEPIARRAWLAFGLALLFWFIGNVAWAVAYGSQPHAPYPSFGDIFWLSWYPFVAVGMFYLIHIRVPQFELHRWMDGIAVTLLVLAAGFALVIQPATEHKTIGLFAAVVAFIYPVLDVLLVGAVLGVYGLLGWKPDTMWLLIGCAIVSTSVADAVFAVQEVEARATVISGNHYDFVWTAGAVLLALAAWAGSPEADADPEAVTGMRAVALALFAQALAIGIQLYAVFREVGRSERVVTIVVLVVASVQIILTRPRRREGDVTQESDITREGDVTRESDTPAAVPLEDVRPETSL